MFKTPSNHNHHTATVTMTKFKATGAHHRYQELRHQGRAACWEPYTNLAVHVIALALEDATSGHKRGGTTQSEAYPNQQDRMEAVEFLTATEGAPYEDRLWWLGLAYPDKDPKHMDGVLQSRLAVKLRGRGHSK